MRPGKEVAVRRSSSVVPSVPPSLRRSSSVVPSVPPSSPPSARRDGGMSSTGRHRRDGGTGMMWRIPPSVLRRNPAYGGIILRKPLTSMGKARRALHLLLIILPIVIGSYILLTLAGFLLGHLHG